jgi:hypothetical protein
VSEDLSPQLLAARRRRFREREASARRAAAARALDAAALEEERVRALARATALRAAAVRRSLAPYAARRANDSDYFAAYGFAPMHWGMMRG